MILIASVLFERRVELGLCIDERGIIGYGRSDRQVSRGHHDFDMNSWRQIQNDATPMPHVLNSGIGRNDVTCVLVPVEKV